jgi:hypothetical protein
MTSASFSFEASTTRGIFIWRARSTVRKRERVQRDSVLALVELQVRLMPGKEGGKPFEEIVPPGKRWVPSLPPKPNIAKT